MLPDGCGLSVFYMSVFVRCVYVICSFNKESRIISGFVYCLFHIFLWFLRTEYTSLRRRAVLPCFVYLLVVCESVWLCWPVALDVLCISV